MFKTSRRNFLKYIGIGTAGTIAAPVVAKAVEYMPKPPPLPKTTKLVIETFKPVNFADAGPYVSYVSCLGQEPEHFVRGNSAYVEYAMGEDD